MKDLPPYPLFIRSTGHIICFKMTNQVSNAEKFAFITLWALYKTTKNIGSRRHSQWKNSDGYVRYKAELLHPVGQDQCYHGGV